MLKDLLDKDPRHLKAAAIELARLTHKTASLKTLKRLIKKILLPLETMPQVLERQARPGGFQA